MEFSSVWVWKLVPTQWTESHAPPPFCPSLWVINPEFRLKCWAGGRESALTNSNRGLILHFSSVLSVRMKKKLERCKNQQSQINSEVSWWYGKNVFNWSFWFRILSGCLYLTLLCLFHRDSILTLLCLFHRDSMQNVTLSSENGLFLHCPRVCYELIDIQSHMKSSSGKRRSILHTNSWSVTLKKKNNIKQQQKHPQRSAEAEKAGTVEGVGVQRRCAHLSLCHPDHCHSSHCSGSRSGLNSALINTAPRPSPRPPTALH